MKKGICLALIMVMLTGCAAEPVYETIGNAWENAEPVGAPGQITLSFPEGTQMEAMDAEDGAKCYRYGDYEIRTETFSSGDISATLAAITGMDAGQLTVVRRELNSMDCYETAWSAMGEEGMVIGRTMVADDGAYHYCVSILLPEDQSNRAEAVFSQIIDSVQIQDTDQ